MDPHLLVESSLLRLAQLAQRALSSGLKRHEFFVVCVDAECRAWSATVDKMMPGHDWKAYRERGVHPIACGTVLRSGFAEALARQAPALARSLRSRPSPGTVHVLSMGMRAGEPYASMYWITPIAEPS